MLVKTRSRVRSFEWERYGERVLSGAIAVCKLTRLGVERHFKDLETGRARGLVFSDAHAQHALESFLFFRHSKGEWAGRPFQLSDWQQFWIAQAFGWQRADGIRRFREVWEEVPRKNGKSTKLAGIGIHLFWFDGEGGAEVYTAATKMDQARITHEEAARMIQSSPHLRRHIGVKLGRIFNPRAGHADVFLPLGRDSKSLDGLNPHGAILDEVHAHRTRDIYDVIVSGLGARRQPLIWGITTAGVDLSSFGYEQHVYAQNVLEGVIEDDEFLSIIYTVDDPDRWDDPQEWAKANPNLGVSVYLKGLKSAADKARRQPTELVNFKTKRLNVWLASGSSWISAEDWRACGDATLRIEDFAGQPCWMGLDLAEKADVAAVVAVFRREQRFYVFCRLFLNEFQVSAPENKHLAAWSKKGFLIVNEGNATDFDGIRRELVRIAQIGQVREVVYDPKFSTYFVKALREDEGMLMVEMPQTPARFTLPVIEIENLVLTRELVHDANPVMAWMMQNVVMKVTLSTNLKYPIKEGRSNKIDGPVAMMMAMDRALANDEEVQPGIILL